MHKDAARRLRDAGLRATAPRRAVLCVLDEHPHETASAVSELTRRCPGRVSSQAIDDFLAAFTRSGLARNIERAGSASPYATRTGANHHLVCCWCGSVTDVDCAVRKAPCLSPDEDADHRLDEAEVVLWGLPAASGPRTRRPDVRHP